MAETGDVKEGQRGWYGKRLKELSDIADQWEPRVTALEERMEALQARCDQVFELVDPEEIEWIWENFRELNEVLSALRRVNGMPPLAEFNGAKARRRKAEAAL